MMISTSSSSSLTFRRRRNCKHSPRYFIPRVLIFILGIMVGLNVSSFPEGELILDWNARSLSSTSLIGNNESLADGWKTINVFYGSTDHAESILPNDRKWYSQARQDEAVISLLGGDRKGYFVDLAANDATLLSNTYALEKHYGWKGLCIEPNPDYFYNLSHYRENCDLVAAVVGRARMEQVYFYEAGDHSGILGFDNPERFKERSKQEYTVTLLEIFEKFGVPKVIDYLSLDVEGAEDFILRVFPLEKYEVRLMTIERPKRELQAFLKSKGYKQIQKLSRWGETLWAHQGAKLDTSHLDDFNAQKQHLAAKALEAREKKSK